MTDVLTTTPDRPKPKRSNGAAHAAVLVSGYELARHFGCSRQNVDLLAQQGVIERRADGKFDQDVSRLKYLAHLRAERQRSPRAAADAEFTAAKAELIKVRIMEKKKVLMLVTDHEALVESMAGLFLTRLSGFPARCAGHDLTVRRAIERAVYDLRREISEACTAMADQRGEPPLDDHLMTDVEMTDAEVAAQIERTDRFIADFRKMVAATVVDPASDAHRSRT